MWLQWHPKFHVISLKKAERGVMRRKLAGLESEDEDSSPVRKRARQNLKKDNVVQTLY